MRSGVGDNRCVTFQDRWEAHCNCTLEMTRSSLEHPRFLAIWNKLWIMFHFFHDVEHLLHGVPVLKQRTNVSDNTSDVMSAIMLDYDGRNMKENAIFTSKNSRKPLKSVNREP